MRPGIEKFLPIFAERLENSFFWIRDPALEKQLYLSPSFDSIWGMPREQVYQDPLAWTRHLSQDDLTMHNAKKMLELYHEKGPLAQFRAVYRMFHPQKGLRWIKDTSFPLYENGVCIGFAGIAEDITQEKEYEAELQRQKQVAEAANEAKSEFIANMSHDIRTAITGMLGLISSWKDRSVDPEDQNDAALLEGCTQELLNLCNDIIETVRIDSGQVEQESVEFSLSELIQHNMTLLMPAAKNKNLQLYWEKGPPIPLRCVGKKVLIDRILLNLMGNAIKFTQQGHVSVKVSVGTEQDDRTVMVTIAVIDTGIGIPNDKLVVIFDKFVRLTASYRGFYKGTGLGLYAVKQFLALLGGDIAVTSVVGQGSQFSVTFPLQVVGHEARVPHQAEKEVNVVCAPAPRAAVLDPILDLRALSMQKKCGTEEQKHQIRILVVEDNPLAALAARHVLQGCGCQVDLATSGKEALQCVQDQGAYHLIFMDIGLPDQTGIEVTAAIRRLEGKKSSVPVVALSGHLDLAKSQDCARVGMNDMLNKPLTVTMAQRTIERWVLPYEAVE